MPIAFPQLSQLPQLRFENTQLIFTTFAFAFALMMIMENTMVFYFPIAVEQVTGSNGVTGLIIGVTNLAALTCDFLFPRIFKTRTWRFFLFVGLLFQICFSFFTNLGVLSSLWLFFILAALAWNIYFEFLAFARNTFVMTQNTKEGYARNWAVFSIIIAIAGLIGPILGSLVLAVPVFERAVILHAIQIAALMCVLFLLFTQKSEKNLFHSPQKIRPLSMLREFGIWEVISARILPVLVVGFLVTMVNAAISTVGGLLGKQIFPHDLDWLIIFLFDSAGIFTSLCIWKWRQTIHKKRLSQVSLLLGSCCLIALFFEQKYVFLILPTIFLCGLFTSSAWVFCEAVYSDLSVRARTNKLYLSSMERVDDSMGWLLAPILIGFLSDKFNYLPSLGILGGVCFFVSVVLLIVTPRKIKLPQEELRVLEKDGHAM
jgi:MFS family permease